MHSFSQLSLLRDSTGIRVVGRSSEVSNGIEEQVINLIDRVGMPDTDQESFSSLIVAKSIDRKLRLLINLVMLPNRDLAGRAIIVPASEYASVDPFDLAMRYPATIDRGSLDPVIHEPKPTSRDVATVAAILKTHDSPLLLGAVQVLLDGGQWTLPLAEAGPNFINNAWQLMPTRSRPDWTFATLAISNDLELDSVVTVNDVKSPGQFHAEGLRCYPNGRYEQALLLAAEQGDQRELDRLFDRKTSGDMMRLVIGMILFALIVVIVMKLI